jgi:hypothetical protein
MADLPDTPAQGLLAQWRRHAVLSAVVAPVLLMVAVRSWLEARLDRMGVDLPPALSPAGDPQALMDTVIVAGLACLAFGLLVWWLVRKPGPGPRMHPSLKWGFLALWMLAWMAGSEEAVRGHFNALGLQPSRTVTLTLAGLKVNPPSLRSLGGARLYLDWPEQGGLYTVLVASPSEDLLKQPQRVHLQLAAGRWSGWYVLGWSVPVPSPRDKATP